MNAALRTAAPGVVVLACAYAALHFVGDAEVGGVASTYGLVVYGAGLSLAWVFHRSRAFIALLVLAWVDIAVVGNTDSEVVVMALGTVVIALLGLLGVLRDRGVLSSLGMAQTAFAVGVTGIATLLFADPERVGELSERAQSFPFETLMWPGYPRVTVGVAVLALLAVVYGFQRYRGPVERSLVWSVILFLMALHPEAGPGEAALLVMATGLMVTLGVVETSYAMAYRDDLTGLPGRRALMQYLDGLSGTYTIAMVDIDHFKQFNDKHGHDVGDQVLQLVAKRIGNAPGGGKAYRYGGEEFTLIYPGRVKEDALPHLEAVRRSVEESRFAVRSWTRPRRKPDQKARKKAKVARRKMLTVTVSLGMADTADEGSTVETVLKNSDEALYRAKKAGRNRVSD